MNDAFDHLVETTAKRRFELMSQPAGLWWTQSETHRAAEIAQMRDYATALGLGPDKVVVDRVLLASLVEDLAANIGDRYPADLREKYQTYRRKYEAEMEPVYTARKLFAAAQEKPHV